MAAPSVTRTNTFCRTNLRLWKRCGNYLRATHAFPNEVNAIKEARSYCREARAQNIYGQKIHMRFLGASDGWPHSSQSFEYCRIGKQSSKGERKPTGRLPASGLKDIGPLSPE
jgi:hypothetical protein